MAIPAYYSLIQRGSSGPDVALVQTWLNGIRDSCTWHAALTVDGKFGANAEKAVREFQLRYGLKEDGKVGANTWNVLYARYTAKHGLIVPYPGIGAAERQRGRLRPAGAAEAQRRGRAAHHRRQVRCQHRRRRQALPDPPRPDLRRLRGQGHLGKDVPCRVT